VTPNQRIADFIGSLATSSAEAICLRIADALAPDQLLACNTGEEVVILAKQLVHAEKENGDPSRAVIICALIDYAFAWPPLPQHVFDRLAEESGDPRLKQVALRRPLALATLSKRQQLGSSFGQRI
jgi:hypothetical protein